MVWVMPLQGFMCFNLLFTRGFTPGYWVSPLWGCYYYYSIALKFYSMVLFIYGGIGLCVRDCSGNLFLALPKYPFRG